MRYKNSSDTYGQSVLLLFMQNLIVGVWIDLLTVKF